MPRCDAVLFDFAGTLVVPRPARELVREAAAGLGLALPGEELDALADAMHHAGIPGAPYPAQVPPALARAYADRDLSAANHRAAYVALLRGAVAQEHAALAEATYATILSPPGWAPYADARATLDQLSALGVKIGLVSNVAFDARAILRAHGLDAAAEVATLSYEEGVAKPDRRLFEVALERLGTEPARTLMVGDNPEADAGAAALGMPVLLLPMQAPGAVQGLEAVVALAR